MDAAKFQRYLAVVDQFKEKHPDWRRGQVLFNALYEVDPREADLARGVPGLDPFHNSAAGPVFLAWLQGGKSV